MLILKNSRTDIDDEFVKKYGYRILDLRRYIIGQILKSTCMVTLSRSIGCSEEKWYIDCNTDTEIFEEFSIISNYVISQKVTKWNDVNILTETHTKILKYTVFVL